MSMCTIFAFGQNEAARPIARSSKRAPTTTSRSASSSTKLVWRAPCMPSMPIDSGWSIGIAPSAISVIVVGMLACSASVMASEEAPELTTPPPR